MADAYWILVPTIVILLVGAVLLWQLVRLARRQSRWAHARRDFHWQRERLEAKFVQIAWTNAHRRYPRWSDCEFDDDVSYVRNRNTGELSAFVRVLITLDAPDDPFDDGSGALRSGTAIFRFDRDHWETDGRAILNLSPSEAIRFYQNDLEIVEQDLVPKR